MGLRWLRKPRVASGGEHAGAGGVGVGERFSFGHVLRSCTPVSDGASGVASFAHVPCSGPSWVAAAGGGVASVPLFGGCLSRFRRLLPRLPRALVALAVGQLPELRLFCFVKLRRQLVKVVHHVDHHLVVLEHVSRHQSGHATLCSWSSRNTS